MPAFLRPTKLKIMIGLGLVLYIFVSFIFLSTLSCARCIRPPTITPFDRIVAPIAYPAEFLILPISIVSRNVFTRETTLREIMVKGGMVNDLVPSDSAALDESITQETPAGLVAGFLVDLALLYLLACCVAALRRVKN